METRAGWQTGDTVCTPVNRSPWAAIASMAGVLITGWPAQPSESARNWSSITISTCGKLRGVAPAPAPLEPACRNARMKPLITESRAAP